MSGNSLYEKQQKLKKQIDFLVKKQNEISVRNQEQNDFLVYIPSQSRLIKALDDGWTLFCTLLLALIVICAIVGTAGLVWLTLMFMFQDNIVLTISVLLGIVGTYVGCVIVAGIRR